MRWPRWGFSPSTQLSPGREWTPEIGDSPATSGGMAWWLPLGCCDGSLSSLSSSPPPVLRLPRGGRGVASALPHWVSLGLLNVWEAGCRSKMTQQDHIEATPLPPFLLDRGHHVALPQLPASTARSREICGGQVEAAHLLLLLLSWAGEEGEGQLSRVLLLPQAAFQTLRSQLWKREDPGRPPLSWSWDGWALSYLLRRLHWAQQGLCA